MEDQFNELLEMIKESIHILKDDDRALGTAVREFYYDEFHNEEDEWLDESIWEEDELDME